ncbi:MAG: DNA polymerase III subunit delta [Ignavibacteria bacterium]
MAKSEAKNTAVPYKELVNNFTKDRIPNNLLIALSEKVLADDLVNIICNNFVGKNFSPSNNLFSFNAEDKNIEAVINECSNTGLFSDKKVIVLKNVHKLLKNAKLALLDYLKRYNPDTCLVMFTSGEKLEPDKIFLYDLKSAVDDPKENRNTIEKNVKMFEVSAFSDADMIKWIREKFDDYKITEETMRHFLQFTNYGFDEMLSEIEKLKTYCFETKEITNDAVNLCNGIAKDFNEMDFIKAVIERKQDRALKIYSQISLRKDVEVYLVFLLCSAFVTINKLFDPVVSKLNGWMLKKELKLWFEDQEKFLPYYKGYRDSIPQDKMMKAFEYIFNTDKILKTSGGDRNTTMVTLINNICTL